MRQSHLTVSGHDGRQINYRVGNQVVCCIKLHPRIIDIDVAECQFQLVVNNRRFRLWTELEGEMREVRHGANGVQDNFDVVVEGEDGSVAEVCEIIEEGGEWGEGGGEGLILMEAVVPE